MSDVRTAFADFAGDLALKGKRTVRVQRPFTRWDFLKESLVANNGVPVTVLRAGATATRINAQGLIELMAADTPRYDYHPVTLACRGLLLEEARTQLVTYTDFSNNWFGVLGPIVAGPMGVIARRETWVAATYPQKAQTIAVVNGVTYTLSVRMKHDVPGTLLGLLSNGGNLALNANVVATGGWDEIVVTATATGTGNANFLMVFDNSGASTSSGCSYSMPQMEAGAVKTSFIPNITAAPVTRNADFPQVNSLAGWFNHQEGTFVVEADLHSVVGMQCLITVSAGAGYAGGNGMLVRSNNSANTDFGGNGSAATSPGLDGKVGGVAFRAAGRYNMVGTKQAVCVNGGAVIENATLDYTGLATRVNFGSLASNATQPMNGHLRRATYYPSSLPTASVKSVTDPATAGVEAYDDVQVAQLAGLEEEDGLETAVVLSLFTDRRALPGDPLPQGAQLGGTPDRRGWWGDSYADVRGDRIGSRLWLLRREKQLPSVLARAREYALEALQWMVDDGIARAVNVTAEIVRNGVLGLSIEIVRSDKPVAQYRFESFWKDV